MSRRVVPCTYCKQPADLVTGAQLYPHRPDLDYKLFWACQPCKAWVGCHPGGSEPLGHLAGPELRQARSAAHDAFDPIWQSGRMSRTKAYRWLSKKLDIPYAKTHIGMFDVDMARRVVDLCRPPVAEERA